VRIDAVRMVNAARTVDAGFEAHTTAVVISDAARAIYVTNLKAASTSIGAWLAKRGGVSDCSPPFGPFPARDPRYRTLSRAQRAQLCCEWPNPFGLLSSACIDQRHAGYWTFSFVRSPIAKFEAGAAEARAQQPRLRNMSADELLKGILRTQAVHAPPRVPVRNWFNEHLTPTAWRLSGATRNLSEPLTFDFIGRVEHLAADWARLLLAWPPLRSLAGAATEASLPPLLNVRRVPPPQARSGGRLSATSICALCRSW